MVVVEGTVVLEFIELENDEVAADDVVESVVANDSVTEFDVSVSEVDDSVTEVDVVAVVEDVIAMEVVFAVAESETVVDDDEASDRDEEGPASAASANDVVALVVILEELSKVAVVVLDTVSNVTVIVAEPVPEVTFIMLETASEVTVILLEGLLEVMFKVLEAGPEAASRVLESFLKVPAAAILFCGVADFSYMLRRLPPPQYSCLVVSYVKHGLQACNLLSHCLRRACYIQCPQECCPPQ